MPTDPVLIVTTKTLATPVRFAPDSWNSRIASWRLLAAVVPENSQTTKLDARSMSTMLRCATTKCVKTTACIDASSLRSRSRSSRSAPSFVHLAGLDVHRVSYSGTRTAAGPE
eukprot:250667-Prymnesium_polylepis.2